MIKKKVTFENEFESKLKKGVNILADAVKTTMGPKGKLVLIQRGEHHPTITKDGVTVAASINLVDNMENMGAKVIKEAASKTAEAAGDGTTSSTVLAQSFFIEGLKMKSAGFQVDLIKEGIDKSVLCIKKFLSDNKKNIENDEELLQVAAISANGEVDIAKLIVGAIKKAGSDGSVIVEEAKGYISSLDYVEGFRLERGFLSPYFISDKNKMTCEFNKPLILIADREFNSIHQLMKPLEMALESGRPILVIANDITGDALQGLVVNKTKGNLRICAIKSPGFGASRHDMLHDLVCLTGGTVITDSFDMTKFSIEDFGTSEKAITQRSSTMLISKREKNSQEKILNRINAIKNRLSTGYDVSENEEGVLRYRLKQLSGGIAILRIGAATESELIERYDRVDDALHATKAAVEEGILPGGGVALARASLILKKLSDQESNQGVKAGIEVASRAIVAPFKQIIKNGIKSPDNILTKILEEDNNMGYDAKNNTFGNMFETGIVDPHKVVRCSLENAASAAKILLSIGCCMIDNQESHESDN